MFACAELGSILDPGNDLRCSEHANLMFFWAVVVASAQSFVLKSRYLLAPGLARTGHGGIRHSFGAPGKG